MNRIQTSFQQKRKLLSIYLTAGFPKLNDTVPIIRELERSGVDMIEIGLPFSDPLADGPTIQKSSTQALKNGMSTKVLFEQLEGIRESTSIPLIIMGYFNPVLQYGVEAFCKQCSEVGIDGLILPDLPLKEYKAHYAHIFEKYNLRNIFLITPQTSPERIREIDAASNAFIYAVSSASTTGAKSEFSSEQINYLNRITNMKLSNPVVVGFGISDKHTFNAATHHTSGAIIGSAFIKALKKNGVEGVSQFVRSIRA